MANKEILSEAARIAKNEYLKQWRKKNIDKVKDYDKTYWERKAANITNIVTVTDIVTDNVTVTDKSNKCIECGNSFQAKRSDTRYCSQACKQKYYRKRVH